MSIRLKEDIWSQIATDMSVAWNDAERVHWIIGRAQLKKRGTDDSFSATRINIPLPPVDEAEVQAPREQQQPQEAKIRWSGGEEDILFAYKNANMSWEQISGHLPGRTAISCETHYFQQGRSGPEWPQERKNQLCKLYERLKPIMWAKIGNVLSIPWEAVEDMHWRLGENTIQDIAVAALTANERLLRERTEIEENNNKVAMAYERLKEDIWSQIATEMSVGWREAELIHWLLGKEKMRKRGTDDSFPTTRINIPLPQVDDAQGQTPGQQQDEEWPFQQQGATWPNSDWSGDEETFLFAQRRNNMLWCDIARLLPGRTAESCYIYHFEQSATGPEWPQERKNELCKHYERLKKIMWAKIGDGLKIPWQSVEFIHWQLGMQEIKKRAEFLTGTAGAALISQAAFRLASPDEDNGEVHQNTDGERDQSSHHPQHTEYQTEPAPMMRQGRPESSITLPSCDEFKAGVPSQKYP
ncbi:hypothetical protein E4U56_007054 [Claviceps arundinis]|uniref:Myb-like domain-containing protein n=1 Tax=Claviceps arundinis TaxID=1623583 RepID=A0A9P7SPR6_9HYPO|nr:hypothetical protein E4U56_007054 [Claviceps arundinis]